MIIPEAIPIRFWKTGQPTFNQKPEAGIDHVCFFQKWNTEDVITLQFHDTVILPYSLQIVSDKEEVLVTIPFVRTLVQGLNVYSLTFRMADFFIEGYVRLRVVLIETRLTGAVTNASQVVTGTATHVYTPSYQITGGVTNATQNASGEVEQSLNIQALTQVTALTTSTWKVSYVGSFVVENTGTWNHSGNIASLTVLTYVEKTGPTGDAQANGFIRWFVNSVMLAEQLFVIGDDVSLNSYHLTLSPGDQVQVIISEI